MKRYIAFLLHVTRGKQHYDFKARLDWLQTESTGNKTTILNTLRNTGKTSQRWYVQWLRTHMTNFLLKSATGS